MSHKNHRLYCQNNNFTPYMYQQASNYVTEQVHRIHKFLLIAQIGWLWLNAWMSTASTTSKKAQAMTWLHGLRHTRRKTSRQISDCSAVSSFCFHDGVSDLDSVVDNIKLASENTERVATSRKANIEVSHGTYPCDEYLYVLQILL